uniref:Invertebrate defensins family profile domain-containing protein n=1 Tax=Panagrolaimus sp. ES5 TaxID=591445 RepID=A0AC34FJK0_9BILA
MKVLFFFVVVFFAFTVSATSAAKCTPGSVVGVGWGWGCPLDGGACHKHCISIAGAGYTSGGCTAMDCQCRC